MTYSDINRFTGKYEEIVFDLIYCFMCKRYKVHWWVKGMKSWECEGCGAKR